jgi:leucyl aminopeptidase
MTPPLSAAPGGAIPIHALRSDEWTAWLAERPASVAHFAGVHDFRAQAGRHLILPASDGTIERIVFGLGERPHAMAFGALGKDLPAGDYRIDYLPNGLSLAQAALGFALGAYAFTRFKDAKKKPARLIGLEGAFEPAERVARAVYLTRDLVNLPANVMGPDGLQREAEALALRIGARFSAIVGEELLAQNYPMIHAVGRAADQAPRLLHLQFGAEHARRIALVGKGVTFDSGGLDIKPDSAMRLMKKDMGGAANVLGLCQAIAEAHLPVRVDAWIPVVENAIGPGAFRPGDVLVSRKGLSVEVDNTDAEGRLILADALTRAGEEAPELVFDFATLTGAARVALGQDLTPLFTDDDSLAQDFAEAGRETGDMVWRLPLWDGYEAEMDCMAADLKNAGDTGQAGAILGGLFLRRFAPKTAWAHLDCYCWTLKERPGRPAGGDAQGLRAALAVLEKRYKAG